MVENIEKVLQRGEKIELLVDKTDQLNQSAFKFKKQAKQVKNVMWWKNVKIMCIIGLIIAAVIFFIVSWACGFPTFKDCGGSDKKAQVEAHGRRFLAEVFGIGAEDVSGEAPAAGGGMTADVSGGPALRGVDGDGLLQ